MLLCERSLRHELVYKSVAKGEPRTEQQWKWRASLLVSHFRSQR